MSPKSMQTVAKFITESLEDSLDRSDISMKDSFFEIGADSVVIVRLRQAIEDEFDVDVSLEDFLNGNYECIEDLCSFVASSLNAPPECNVAQDMSDGSVLTI